MTSRIGEVAQATVGAHMMPKVSLKPEEERGDQTRGHGCVGRDE
jgi:hypothetical protein